MTERLHFHFYVFLKKIFIYLFLLCWVFIAIHGLCLVAESRGSPLVVVRGLLIVVASLVVEHGLLDMWALVITAGGLSSCSPQA